MKKINLSLSSLEPLIQKISDLTKIQRILLGVGVVGVVIGLFVWIFYMPQIRQQSDLSKSISEQTTKLKKVKTNAEAFGKYKALMEEKKAEFKIASKQLPQTDEVPTLLRNISQAGKDAGLDIILFMPQTERKKNFYAEIPVKMELSGSFNDLGVFFDRIAGMSRIVNINSFDLTSALNTGRRVRRTRVRRVASSKGGRSKGPGIEDIANELTIKCVAETYKFIESSKAADENASKGKKRKRGRKR